MQLRPYQQNLKNDIYDGWANGCRNMLAVSATGSGKTVLFGSVIRDHDGPSCAIAHRQELVSQISMALAREELRHRIIGPQPVIRDIVQAQTKELGRSWYDPTAPAAVAGVDTLLKRTDALANWLNSVTLWVQDECFIKGTLIDGIPIEKIKTGDYVTAFDDRTGEFRKKRVIRLFKNKIKDDLVIVKVAHHVLTCTKGHPFWTKRGWINAIDLRDDDELLLYRMWCSDNGNKRGAALSLQKNWQNFLQPVMWLFKQGQKTPIEIKNKKMYPLSYLWEKCTHYLQLKENGPRLLLKKMFGSLQESYFFDNNVGNKQKTRIGEDEKEQSYEATKKQGKNDPNFKKNKTSTQSSGWKWKRCYDAGKNIIQFIQRLQFHKSSDCTNRSIYQNRVPKSLQNRLREHGLKNSYRSGWFKSFINKKTTIGQKKGFVSKWQRLDSIEIFKLSDIEQAGSDIHDGYVYNIEVEGLHTYVANNLVVHNCHHLLRANKWGRAIELFPNAKGLGVTATPTRADGAGLGRHADGVFDHMVEGPGMRWLIDQGYLTDYRIFAPPSDLIMDDGDVGSTGDYSAPKMRAKAQKSHIIGDVVTHYLRIAPGKRGVTFATDVETATEMAARFNAAGVPAAVVHAKSKNRDQIVRDFRAGKYMMLVNVDIFGEGFDLPAIDVVIMARPTMSYSLYAQQFGRALRIMDGKLVAIIIDHVGNVMRHGLPDRHREWTLDRREKRSKGRDPDVLPTRTCQECLAVYEAIYVACPYCHHVNEPAGRSRPEQVDGDLLELDPATLAAMRGEIARIDESHLDLKRRMEHAGAPRQAINGAVANHRDRQDAQHKLRDTIALWAGYQRQAGRPDSESYRRFYFRYGVDVATAQTLGRRDAEDLCQKIANDLFNM